MVTHPQLSPPLWPEEKDALEDPGWRLDQTIKAHMAIPLPGPPSYT